MTTPSVIGSAADLMSTVPSDFFESAPADTGTVDTGSAETGADVSTADDGAIDTLEAPASVEGEEPAAEPEPKVEPEPEPEPEAPAAEPQKPAEPAEELPEGVTKGKDRNGKEGLFLTPQRYELFHGAHKLLQQTAEMLGESVTPEALQVRHEAYVAQERLFNDVTSGDPSAQGNVLNYMFDEMTRAREEGAVGVDPAIPFATTFYSTVKERAPEAYASLRFQAAKDLLGEMFSEAAEKGDDNLFLSTQHIARALAGFGKDVNDPAQLRAATERAGLPFYTKAEMQGLARGADPVAQLRAENARLNQQLNGRQTNTQAAQFDAWFNGTKTAVNTAIASDAITPALESVAQAWKAFPQDYQRLVVDPLHREVVSALKANRAFGEEIEMLHAQARRAQSAQIRERIGQQIQQRYVNRAKLVADAKKGEILKFAANWLSEQSRLTHARRQDAQDRTAPRGTSSPVPRSLVPTTPSQMNGVYDPDLAVKELMTLLR